MVSTPNRLNASAVLRTGQGEGLRVVEVLAGSPADRACLQPGHIILTAGRRAVRNAGLQRLLFADAVGQPLQIGVLRRGEEMNLVAVPEEMQANGQ